MKKSLSYYEYIGSEHIFSWNDEKSDNFAYVLQKEPILHFAYWYDWIFRDNLNNEAFENSMKNEVTQ